MKKLTIKTQLLGAHLSIAGGFERAVTQGDSIGCGVIQIFTKSNRSWFDAPLSTKAIEEFRQIKKQSSVVYVCAHSSYLINIITLYINILKYQLF